MSLFFLFASFQFSSAQDICTACKSQGCLESYEVAKSEYCKSCHICLVEPKCSVSGENEKCAETDAQNNKNPNNSNVAPPSTIINTINRPRSNPKDEQKRCEKSDDTAKCRDLRAQETVAFWSKPTFIAGALGVLGLVVAILQTGKAIKAANRANDISSQLLARDRAWISMDFFDHEIGLINDKVAGIDLFYSFKNFGKAPAIKVSAQHAIVVDASVAECLRILGSETLNFTDNIAIPPTGKIRTPDKKIVMEDIQSIIKGEKFAVFVGAVKYADGISKEERKTVVFRQVKFNVVPHSRLNIKVPRPYLLDVPQKPDILT